MVNRDLYGESMVDIWSVYVVMVNEWNVSLSLNFRGFADKDCGCAIAPSHVRNV